MKILVLASGSPSRKEILEETKFPFIVDVSNYEEDMELDLPPKELAISLSQSKAHVVAKRHMNAVILAADSFVVFQNKFLGKPHTVKRAKEMLTLLSGQCHSFITGYTVLDTDTGREHTEAVETKVYFKPLTSKEIDDYLARDDVLEKAGAYNIADQGKKLVQKVVGDHTNVRGLPLASVAKVLRDFGLDFKV